MKDAQDDARAWFVRLFHFLRGNLLATEIQELVSAFTVDLSDLNRGFDQAEKKASKFGNFMGGVGRGISTVLATTVSAGAAAFGGAIATIGQGVNVAADLEQQAANISATFGNMAPPMAEVEGLINDLALDPSLVVGVAEAGAGIEMLAKNGLNWQQIAGGAARSSILLANATGADLAASADIATNAIGIFGLETENLNDVVATMVNVANSSQFGVEELGFALANAGPKAAAMGWNMQELFGAMSMSASGFASATTMGTSFAWLINGLTPSTNKAKDAMKELGLMTEDGANAFFNADGSGKSFQESIKLLQGAFAGLSDEQRQTYAETIFGQEAFGALSGVLALNNDELAALIPQLTDFSAVEAGAEKRTSTYRAAMEALADTINSIFGMIGKDFLPTLTKLSRWFADFAKTKSEPVIAFFKNVATVFGNFIDGILSGHGVLTSLARMFDGLLPPGLQKVWAMFTNVLIRLYVTFADLVSAASPVVKAFMNMFRMLTRGSKVTATLSNALAGFVQTIRKVGSVAAMIFKGLGQNLKFVADIFTLRFAVMTTENASWGEKMLAVWDMVGQVGMAIWSTLLTNLSALLPQWLESLGEWALGLWQWIVESAPGALAALGQWALSLFGWAWENLPQWLTAMWEWGVGLWSWIVENAPAAIQQLSLWVTQLWTWASANYPIWVETMSTWATALWQWISEAIPVVMEVLGGWWTAVIGWVAERLPGWIAAWLDWQAGIWEWIGASLPDAIRALAEWITGVNAEGEAGENTFMGMVGRWAGILWRWIVDEALPQIAPSFARFVSAISEAGWGIWDALVYMGGLFATVIWNWVLESLPFLTSGLETIGGVLWGWLVGLGQFIWNTVRGWATTLWEWLMEPAERIDEWLNNISNGFLTWKDIVLGAILGLVVAFAPAILGAMSAGASAIGAFLAAAAPILLWVAAGIAAVALMRHAWENDFGGIRTFTEGVLEKLGEAFGPLLETIQEFGFESLKEIANWLLGNEEDFTATKKIWEDAQTAFEEVFDAIMEKLDEWGELAQEWFEENFPESAEVLTESLDEIKAHWEGFVEAIQPIIEFFGELWAGVVADWESGSGNIATAVTVMQGILDTAFAILGVAIETFVSNAILLLTMVAQLLTGDFAGAWRSAKAIVFNTVDGLGKILLLFFNRILGYFDTNVDEIVGWAKRLNDLVHGKIKEWFRFGVDIIRGLKDGMRQAWRDLSDWFTGVWGQLTDRFKRFFGIASPSKLFTDYGANMMQGLNKGIKETRGLVMKSIDDLSTGVNLNMQGASLVPEANADYAGLGSFSRSEPKTETARIESLLVKLIEVLRDKEMVANVKIESGRSNDLSSLVQLTDGLR